MISEFLKRFSRFLTVNIRHFMAYIYLHLFMFIYTNSLYAHILSMG